MDDAALVPSVAGAWFIGPSAPMLLKVVTGAVFGWGLSRAVWALLRAHAVTRYLLEE